MEYIIVTARSTEDLQAVEQCEPSLPGEGNNDSWITNPERLA